MIRGSSKDRKKFGSMSCRNVSMIDAPIVEAEV
jgi:hypothetical protein